MISNFIFFYDQLKRALLRNNFIISKEQDKLIKKIINDLNHYLSVNEMQSKIKILYLPSYYQIGFTRIVDILMALSLRARGCDVTPVLTEDFHSKECVIYGGIYNKNRKRKIAHYDYIEKKIWMSFLSKSPFFLKDFRIKSDFDLAKDLVKNISEDNYQDYFYLGYPVGKKACEATLNMNNMPKITREKDIVQQLGIHAENIIQLLLVYERIFDFYQPDVVFSNFPFYYKWGVAYNAATRRRIPFYSALLAEKRNSIFFSESDKIFDSSSAWPTFQNIEFTKEQEEIINNLISKRMKRDFCHYSPYPDSNPNSSEFRCLISSISKEKKLVFFPVNVFFDAVVFQKTPVFSNLVDMLEKMIDFFNDNPEYQLIIKAHPAEKLFYKGGAKYSDYCLKNVLAKVGKSINKNIVFLDYNTTISTYDIVPFIDLGIVYTSSTAIEMAWFGKPVISIAKSHYSEKGFTFEPKDNTEFFDMIHNVLNRSEGQEIINKRIQLSKKYYYLYFGHSLVDFKMLQGSDTQVVVDRLNIEKYTDLLPGRCEALDYICDAIVNKVPIYGENRWPPETV